MKKRKNCATGGSLDPSSMLSVLGPLLGTVNPVLGAVPQLMQQYINKQKQDAIVVSATPGNYNYGGPVYPPVQQSMLPAPFPIESTYVNTLVNPLMSLATSPLTREELWRDSRPKVYGKDIYTTTTKVGTGGSSHSKSKGRMSFADGGPIENNRKATQFDWSNTGQPATNTSSPRGTEESGRNILSKGSKGAEVLQAQQFLQAKGFYKGKQDGIFGAKTEQAVKAYQKWFNENAKTPVSYVQDGKPTPVGPNRRKVAVDGIIGDETRAALMYRDYNPKQPEAQTNPEFPVGSSILKQNVTDNRVMGSPDVMNYRGGMEMLGLVGALTSGFGMIPAATEMGAAESLTANGLRSIGSAPRIPLNPTVPNGGVLPGGRWFSPQTPSAFGSRIGYASGGQMDAQLASDSFQVKGHPNKTDGNYYPEYNANLDHNEVVKDSFVFSDKLKIGKDSFAKLAKIIEVSTGKAEKALKINPDDTAALNTIKHNETRSAALAARQEQQATAMGLRDNTRNFATGGPTDPPYSVFMPEWDRSKNSISRNILLDPYLWNPVDATTGKRRKVYTPDDLTGDIPEAGHSMIDLGRDNMFYDPYKQQIVVRNKKGFYVPVKPREGDFVRDKAGNIIDQTTGRSFNPQAHMAYDANPTVGQGPVAATAPTAAPNNTSVVDSSSRARAIESLTVPPVAPPVSGPGGGGGPRQQKTPAPTSFPGAPRNPNYVDPQMDLYVNGNTEKYSPVAPFNQLPSQYGAKQTYPVNNITTPGGEIVDMGQLGPSNGMTSPGLYQNFATSNRNITAPAPPNIDTSKSLGFDQAAFNAATPGATGSGNSNKWATGDYLQAAKVLSGFGQLLGGSEREKPNYDNTQITQSVYDPNQALMQNQRTYKDSMAGFDAPSINTRRAYDNALYANKLGQDNQVISQYAQMNQQGRQQYEQRTADQRRYNVGQTTYTNDINARNRAAYKEAVDTAFTGLSNFGVGLNQKKQGYDTLGILKTMYPDVYANIMKSLNG